VCDLGFLYGGGCKQTGNCECDQAPKLVVTRGRRPPQKILCGISGASLSIGPEVINGLFHRSGTRTMGSHKKSIEDHPYAYLGRSHNEILCIIPLASGNDVSLPRGIVVRHIQVEDGKRTPDFVASNDNFTTME
jgi:hypothetical protein